jgi:hypothetical protein
MNELEMDCNLIAVAVAAAELEAEPEPEAEAEPETAAAEEEAILCCASLHQPISRSTHLFHDENEPEQGKGRKLSVRSLL